MLESEIKEPKIMLPIGPKIQAGNKQPEINNKYIEKIVDGDLELVPLTQGGTRYVYHAFNRVKGTETIHKSKQLLGEELTNPYKTLDKYQRLYNCAELYFGDSFVKPIEISIIERGENIFLLVIEEVLTDIYDRFQSIDLCYRGYHNLRSEFDISSDLSYLESMLTDQKNKSKSPSNVSYFLDQLQSYNLDFQIASFYTKTHEYLQKQDFILEVAGSQNVVLHKDAGIKVNNSAIKGLTLSRTKTSLDNLALRFEMSHAKSFMNGIAGIVLINQLAQYLDKPKIVCFDSAQINKVLSKWDTSKFNTLEN